MKVLVVLALLSVAAFAAFKPKAAAATLKKRLIGGPDSLPYFLRPGYKKPQATKPETSGFVEDATAQATVAKNKIVEAATTLKNKVVEKAQKVKAVLTSDETKAKVAALKQRAVDLKNKVVEKAQKAKKYLTSEEFAAKRAALKNKVVEGAKNVKAQVVDGAKKLKKLAQEKLTKENLIAAKDQIVETAKKVKDTVVKHAKAAHKIIKEKVTKKPVVEQSGFVDDAKVAVKKAKTTVVNKATTLGDKLRNHAKNAHKWIKNKLAKKETPAPVVEQSGFSEDVSEKMTKAKESAKSFFAGLKNKAQVAYANLKAKLAKKQE